MRDEIIDNAATQADPHHEGCAGTSGEHPAVPAADRISVAMTRKERNKAVIEQAIAAIADHDLAALAKLVKNKKQANWHRPDHAWCLLDEAVKRGSCSIVNWLLVMGANPNTLFKRGRPISLRNATEEGWYFSPFATAICDGNAEAAALMIKAGANLDLPCDIDTEDGATTCQEKIDDHELWPAIEAYLIAWSTPLAASKVSSGGPRL